VSHQIPLGKEKFTLVDGIDFDRLKNIPWFLSGTGYAVGFMSVGSRPRLVYLHRFLMNAQPGQLVDHINGDALDNRRENLRLATARQNVQNKCVSPLSATGLKGVGWHKRRRKFHARIQLQGVRVHLGYFEDARSAALAYDAAARMVFGSFARCNYPDEATPRLVALQVAQRLKRHGLRAPAEYVEVDSEVAAVRD